MKIQIILVLLILDKRIDFNSLINAKTLFALTSFEFKESKKIINITRTSGPKVSQKEMFDDVAIW